MPVETPQQPLEDARKLVDASSRGLSADCIFQGWSNERQLAAYRELNKIQDPTDAIPDLQIDMDVQNTRHLVRQGHGAADRCTDLPKVDLPPMTIEINHRDVEFEKIAKAARPGIAASEAERMQHPEVPAKRIEDIAIRSLNGDENANLELRVQLEKLMKEPNGEFRNQVLKKLAEDGAKWGGDAPYLTINNDEQGNPDNIDFKKTRFSMTKETVPLNQTVEEQVAKANADFIWSLQNHPQGFGKFKPEEGIRALDILAGTRDVKEPSWFMIYRQQHNLPMLDRTAIRTAPEQ